LLTNHTLDFLSELSKNNHKEWFELNRNRYEQSQTNIKLFIKNWIEHFGRKEETIAHLEPQKCIFRIHRDVRFSADKTPYKTNLGAYLSKGGKNTNFAGYYLHIQPNACFFGAGNYMPTPEQLAKIRQEIDYNYSDFLKIITAKRFKETFGNLVEENKLKRAPKGYEDDNKAIEYLKLKSFIVSRKITDNELTSADFIKTITEYSTTVKPFIDFLNHALE